MIINNVVYGGPALTVPGHLNFGQHLIDSLRRFAQDPNRVALINGDTSHKLTYSQMLQQVANTATGLRRLGVRRGSVVAFCSENRDEYMVASIAAICCGATITTASLHYTKDELIHVLNISKPHMVLGSEEGIKQNMKAFKAIPSIKKIVQFDGQVERGVTPFSTVIVDSDVNSLEADEVEGWSDVVFILYSSGTTGLPKGVMLTHLNAVYAAMNFVPEESEYEVKNFLTLVPWYHAYGLMSTMNYLSIGMMLVYFPVFDPLKYLTAIQEYKINVLLVVPPLVVFLAKHPIVEEFDLSSVTSIWCGAAPLSSETIELAMKRFPNCTGIYQAYGMTETSLAATKDTEDANIKPKPGSGGFPLKGIKAKVVDLDTGKKLGVGEKGEICLKGPIIMKGYAGDKAATKAIMDEEGYLKTGDIGYFDGDGYFFIVDRLKELIKYKGNQVPPAHVENVLLQHPAVAECGVVGAPNEKAGELPTAFVVLKPGMQATEKELLEFTNQLLSPEKRLYGGIIFVNDIPKNPSGKILRRVLKQQLLKKRKSKI